MQPKRNWSLFAYFLTTGLFSGMEGVTLSLLALSALHFDFLALKSMQPGNNSEIM